MKIYAISDLHVSYPSNRRVIEEIGPYPDDWLIIAGDVGDTTVQIEWALQVLANRFQKLIWVPGNHDLWTLPNDPVQLRGEARYRYLVELCRSKNIFTPEDPYPSFECEGVEYVIAPLFLLYDYSFRPVDMDKEEALERAFHSNVVSTDEFLLHPDPYSSREEWCRARVEWTATRLAQIPSPCQLILVSHFPLRQDLVRLPHIPLFSLWCGTELTEDWHQKYRASLVIMGHLHTPGIQWRDGVRFEEVSLGYPYQRNYPGHNWKLREVLCTTF